MGGIDIYDIWLQCESMETVEKKLKEMEIEYMKCRVDEGGIYVDQLFFHDPDGLMIEICNCDNLPVIPLVGESLTVCSRINCNVPTPKIPVQEDYLHCA